MGKPKGCHGPACKHGSTKVRSQEKAKAFEIELVDASGIILTNIPYIIKFTGGKILQGITDEKGMHIRKDVPKADLSKDFEITLKKPFEETTPQKDAPEIKPSITGKIERGANVKFTVEKLPGDSHIRSWTFVDDVSPQTIVERSEKEEPSTWEKSWQGQIAAPGSISIRYELKKKKVVDSEEKVNWRVNPWEKNAAVKYKVEVAPRKGWDSTVAIGLEKPTSQIPADWLKPDQVPSAHPEKFSDLGKHVGRTELQSADPTVTISSGPNNGYSLVSALKTISFHSFPFIHDDLLDPSSDFSRAQDGKVHFQVGDPPQNRTADRSYFTVSGNQLVMKDWEKFRKDHNIPVYLTEPKFDPKKVIDPAHWTISNGNVELTITDATFRKNYEIGDKAYRYVPEAVNISPLRIGRDRLLANAQRHEYAGKVESHRANFEKAHRALDPKKYAESLTAIPGKKKTLFDEIKNRVKLVEEASSTHNIIDEDKTRSSGKLEFIVNKKMLPVNQDDNGAFEGAVWDPRKNQQFPT